MKRLLPNSLSILRLLLTPVVVCALLGNQYAWALWALALAAVTDALDGYLARVLNSATQLGAYLDPIADKVLLGAIYLSLGGTGALPWWLVVLVFARDLFILAATGLALLFTTLRGFEPSLWGKLSTLIQIVTAFAVIADRATARYPAITIESALIWLTAAATVWSGLHYCWRGWTMLR